MDCMQPSIVAEILLEPRESSLVFAQKQHLPIWEVLFLVAQVGFCWNQLVSDLRSWHDFAITQNKDVTPAQY
jgi:hypothetical protein